MTNSFEDGEDDKNHDVPNGTYVGKAQLISNLSP